MKHIYLKVLLSTLVILIQSHTSLAATFYSIQHGEWDLPGNWSFSPTGPPAPRFPSSTDHVIISHHISLTRPSGYIFRGNILVNQVGTLQIFTGNAVSQPFVFAGDLCEVNGTLITSSDFHHQQRGTNQAGTLSIGAFATFTIGDDLILNALGNTILDNASCGQGSCQDDIYFVGEQAQICGSGRFIVPDRIRSWLDNGTEITNRSDAEAQISTQMCSSFTLYGSAGSCHNNTARVTGTGSFDLPVKWLDFAATMQQGEVLIHWATAKEINNDYFQIESSIDGQAFQSIGQVQGMGTSLQVNTYSFVAPAASASNRYFRIRQVDMDGKFSFSSVIELREKTIKSSFDILHKQEQGIVLFFPAFQEETPLRVNMLDQQGKTALTQALSPATQYHQLYTVGLPGGMYLIQVQYTHYTQTKKVIIR